MPAMDGRLLAILVIAASLYLAAGAAWRGIQHAGHELGCGVRVIFTGHGCGDTDVPEPVPEGGDADVR